MLILCLQAQKLWSSIMTTCLQRPLDIDCCGRGIFHETKLYIRCASEHQASVEAANHCSSCRGCVHLGESICNISCWKEDSEEFFCTVNNGHFASFNMSLVYLGSCLGVRRAMALIGKAMGKSGPVETGLTGLAAIVSQALSKARGLGACSPREFLTFRDCF